MALFANAKKVKAPSTKSKAEVATVDLVGMERYAALDAAIKSLTALKDAEEASLKSLMGDHFIELGCATKKRPANFNGVDGMASGSCQLKVRSTTSPLSEDDQNLLREHSVPMVTNIKTAEAFLINPSYTRDMALLAKVEQALESVELPDDFLLKQDEISTTVANDLSVEAVFKLEADVAEILLPIVTTMAIRPTIGSDFWGIIDNIMSGSNEEETA